MPRVNIEGFGAVNFPDDMTEEEISSVIENEILKQTPAPAAEQPVIQATPVEPAPLATQALAAEAPVGELDVSVGDLARRLPAGISEASADSAAGILKTVGDVATIPSQLGIDAERAGQSRALGSALNEMGTPQGTDAYREYLRRRKAGNEAQSALAENPNILAPAINFARDVSANSRDAYGVDATRDGQFISQVFSGAGSLVPALATGPMAPVTIAGMMGETGRKDAEESGGTPEQQNQSFYSNAAVGALSEAMLGIPALLRAAKASKIPMDTLRKIVANASWQALKQGGREGAQEGIEQAAANIIASDVAGYDPERKLSEGVLRSALVGAVIGAPVGGVVQIAEDLDSRDQSIPEAPIENPNPIQNTEWRGGGPDTTTPPAESALAAPEATPEAPAPVEHQAAALVEEAAQMPAPQNETEAKSQEVLGVQPEAKKPFDEELSYIDFMRRLKAGENMMPVATPAPEPVAPTPQQAFEGLAPIDIDAFERLSDQPLQEGNVAYQDELTSQVFQVPENATTEQITAEVDRVRQEEMEAIRRMRQEEIAADLGETAQLQETLQKLEIEKPPEVPLSFWDNPIRLRDFRDQTDISTVKPADKAAAKAVLAKINERLDQLLVAQPSSLADLTVTTPDATIPASPAVAVPAAAPASTPQTAPAASSAPTATAEPEVEQEPVPSPPVMQQVDLNPPPPATPPPDAAAPQGQPAEQATGMRNSVTDEVRARLGLPERQTPEGRGFQTLLDEAEVAMTDNPKYGELLVKQLKDNPRPLTDTEDAVLTRQLLDAVIEVDSAAAYMNSATPDNQAMAAARMQQAQQTYDELSALSSVVGTANSRGLNARKLMVKNDFSLARMTAMQMAVEFNGETVPEEKRKEVQKRVADQHDKIKAEAAKAEAATEAAELNRDEEFLDNVVKEEAPEVQQPEDAKKRKLQDYLNEKAADARKNLKGKIFKLGSTPDVTIIKDLAVIGASNITNGITKFSAWSQQMLSEFGDAIKPHLKLIFGESKKQISEARKQVQNQKPTANQVLAEAQQQKVKKVDRELVAKVVRAHVRAGLRGVGPVIKATTETLQGIDANLTESEVRRTFSDYGNVRYPKKDEISTEVRRLTTLSRLLEQLADVRKGKVPERTGYQRDKTDAEIRDLEKQIRNEMRALGLQTTDPEKQVASSLAAAKRRIENEMADIDKAIADNKALQKSKPTQYTAQQKAELDALQAKLDVKREQYAKAFPPQPASQEEQIAAALKSLDQSIAEEEQMLADGILKRPPNAPGVTSPEIEDRKMILEALRQTRRELYQAQNPGKSAEQVWQEQALKAAEKALARYDAMLSSGNLTPQQQQAKFQNNEVDDIRMEVAAMAELVRVLRNDARPKTTKEERLIKSLEKSIKLMQGMLQTGNVQPKAKIQDRPEIERISRLRDQRDALAKQVADARKAGRTQLTEEEKQLKALDREIKSIQERIAQRDVAARQRNQNQPDTADVAKRKEIKASLRETLSAIRDTDLPDLQTQRNIAQVARRRVELENKIKEGNFTKPTPKQRKLDDLEERARFDYQKVRNQWLQGVFEAQLANRTKLQKAMGFVGEAINTSRSVMTSIDLSAMLRQGGFVAMAHPIMAAKVFGQTLSSTGLGYNNVLEAISKGSLKGFFTQLREGGERAQFAVNEEIRKRRNAPLYARAKLYLHDDTNPSLSQMEEAYMGRLASKLPLVAGSQRVYTTFLNKLRADSFDSLMQNLTTTGTATEEEAKAIANFVNVATGRADLGKLNSVAAGMNYVFFAPRYVASRFQLIAGQPMYGGTKRTRQMIGKEYGRYLLGVGTVAFLASLLNGDGDDSELKDMTSSDWLKIRFGNTRLDPYSGLAQPMVFLARSGNEIYKTVATPAGEKREKSPYGDGSEVLFRFVRSKLNPAAGAIVDISAGKNIVGEQVTLGGAAFKMSVPISTFEIAEVMQEQGMAKGPAFALASILGVGVQTYEKKSTSSTRKPGAPPRRPSGVRKPGSRN